MEKDDYTRNIYIKNKKENDEQILYNNVELIKKKFDGGYYLNYRSIHPLKNLETETYYLKQYERKKNKSNKKEIPILFIIICQLLALYIPWFCIFLFWGGGVFLKICCILVYLIWPSFLFLLVAGDDFITIKMEKLKKIIEKYIKTLPKLKSNNIKKNFVPKSWRDVSGKLTFPLNKKYIRVYLPETFIIIPDEETKNQIELGKFYFGKENCLNNKTYLVENEQKKTSILEILLYIFLFICNLHFVIYCLISKETIIVPYLIIKVISVNQDFTSNYNNDFLFNLNPEIFSKKFSVEEISKLNDEKDIEEVNAQVQNYLEDKKEKEEEKKKRRQNILDKLNQLGLEEGEFNLITKKLQTATLTIRRKNLKVKVEVHFKKFNDKGMNWWVDYDIDGLYDKPKINCRSIEGGYEFESKFLPGNVKFIANGRSIDIEFPNDYGYPQYKHLDFYEK